MKYTHYKNRFSSSKGGVSHLSGEWSDIVDLITDKSQWRTFNADTKEKYDNAKAQFDAIVMADMVPNMPRTADNVIAFYAIVLDIDDGATYQEVRNDLKDYEYVMYSSGGTGIKKGDRFRVILPLNTPMAAREWKNYNTSFTERFPYSDECFKKGIQIQYLPTLNSLYEDKFIAEHHKGKWFDYQNPEDLPYVENRSIESIVKNVVFDEAQFTSDEYLELAKAIIEHQAGQLEYEERRLLAQRLKHIGMDDFSIIQVLAQVSRPGYSVSNESIVAGANPQYAHVEGLYKHVAKGTRIPAIERRIVRSTTLTTPLVDVCVYDGEWTLEQGEYLSDIFNDMDFTTGINLLISDVGTGKSTQFMKEGGGTKDGFIFLAPLTSIVLSFKGDNKTDGSGVATWNQIESIIKTKDKTKFKDMTLVIDECHGLYADYGYKARTINRLISMFDCFKSVILMSGTVEPRDYSSIKFNKVYRVHKPSESTKRVYTFFSSKKDDCVIDMIESLSNKTIVLMNDKDLGKVTSNRITRKHLIVNADVKGTKEVQDFYTYKLMGEYDVIIGTNSIVEGLSIEDDLQDVDIVIWGNQSPERIEQFCNRFRNVSGTKNVWYFVDRKPVDVLDDYERESIIDDTKTLCSGLQGLYEGITSDVLRRSFINQFQGDMSKDMVYFHDSAFHTSFTGIDYEYSEYRTKQYSNDFGLFSSKMMEFGFEVQYPMMVDGDEQNADKIKEDKKVVKEARKAERKQELEKLISDIERNEVLEDDEASELYNTTYESIQKLLMKGMDKKQVSYAIGEYIDNEKFFAEAHRDAEYFETGNTVRELVIDEINGKNELTTVEIQDIADKVVNKVLCEYFNGDVEKMVESRSWGGLVSKCLPYNSNDLYKQISKVVTKSTKAAKDTLQKFITLDKSVQKRANGQRQSVSPIRALSVTGLTFSKIDYSSVIGAGCLPCNSNDLYKQNSKVVSNTKTFVELVQDAYAVVQGLDVYQRAAYATSLMKQATMSDEDKATYIACSKFAKFKKQSAQEIIDSL